VLAALLIGAAVDLEKISGQIVIVAVGVLLACWIKTHLIRSASPVTVTA
jgi:hypothetical protein